MIAIKHVLVATDFSPASQTALAYGRALARTFGGSLHVVHVVEDVLSYALTDGMGASFIPSDLQAALDARALGQLDEVIGDDDRRELRAKTVVRRGANAALEIVQYAKDNGIDVIVIGTQGRGGLSRLLVGSVAAKVVRLAPCPVLSVHHPEHEFVLPDALQRVQGAGA